MMSLSVEQFLQVKCKLQLTSETDSSESIHSNCERVRLCTSVDLDRNSTLIVIICSNEVSNNYILAYYVERRVRATLVAAETSLSTLKLNSEPKAPQRTQSCVTFSQLANITNPTAASSHGVTHGYITRSKPRIVTKQIFYHQYNEDIVAIHLSESGNKLVLVSASSTIYLIPIKNILLNLHAKQLQSSQGKSMYFYDASILDCCSLQNPISVVYWESIESENKSLVIIASQEGVLNFISVEEKKVLSTVSINEKISSMEVIRDRFSYSLLITAESYRQYRFALEIIENLDQNPDSPSKPNSNDAFIDEYAYLVKDIMPSWDRKPIPINLHSSSLSGGRGTAAVIHRVFSPSTRVPSQAGLFSTLHSRDRSVALILPHPEGLICVVDALGIRKSQSTVSRALSLEPRLLRFFSSKQFYYRPQKPVAVFRLTSLEPDELITHAVLTDRFLAIATDRDRCLINSRYCCNLRYSSSSMDLDPLVKKITFNHNEKILSLLKSPVSNDQDGIIDSFLIVTNRSIYSIEARQTCREMYISLIDSHLGLKPQPKISTTSSLGHGLFDPFIDASYSCQRRNSGANLIVSNFLSHRDEVYERINYDSRVFSILFKLELSSLFETYADRLLRRGQFDLANRFFQMAKFDHMKTLERYFKLGAYKQTVDYVVNILSDENQIIDEKGRMDLARTGFDSLLAKTLVERSKTTIYKKRLRRKKLKRLREHLETITKVIKPSKSSKADPFRLCEHTPKAWGAKLSANTIVVEACEDDEATMTACLSDRPSNNNDVRLECERRLVEFVRDLMPPALQPYVLNQLVGFNLLDLANLLANSDVRVYYLVRILLKSKSGNRILFRDGRFEGLVSKLISSEMKEIVRIDSSEPKFLEFITSPQVNRALVRDIDLTTQYLGSTQDSSHFRRYSFAALRQLDSFRKLVISQNIGRSENFDPNSKFFNRHQRQSIENIFVEFLNACLDESIEDSCRLWTNYINFYLNYVGSTKELESDLLNLLESKSSDCRLAITLFKAIAKSENSTDKPQLNDGIVNNSLDCLKEFFNLSELFENKFLMKLLAKTLTLIPQSADLDALSDCLGVDGLQSAQ